MKLESLLQYLDAYLGVPDHPDYPHALNGLQVGGPDEVSHVMAAVDASEASIAAAVEAGADLLLVHHGLFWEGLRPVTGRRLRRLGPLIEHGVALYSAHLPLDSHPEVGNCALLGRALGLEPRGRFAAYHGFEIGWWGELPDPVDVSVLGERLKDVLDGARVHVIPGGPAVVGRVGVVTGVGRPTPPKLRRSASTPWSRGRGRTTRTSMPWSWASTCSWAGTTRPRRSACAPWPPTSPTGSSCSGSSSTSRPASEGSRSNVCAPAAGASRFLDVAPRRAPNGETQRRRGRSNPRRRCRRASRVSPGTEGPTGVQPGPTCPSSWRHAPP